MSQLITSQALIESHFLPPWPLPQQSPKLNDTRKWNGWQHPKRRLIVCVEGNIGSGKSTLINSLEKKGWRVYQEPVEDRWKTPLQDFYKDPVHNGLPFQIKVLEWFKWLRDNTFLIPQSTQNDQWKNAQWKAAHHSNTWSQQNPLLGTLIIERSPWAAFLIFSTNLHANGLLTTNELRLVYDVVSCWGWIPDVTLYVHTPWEIALQRTQERGRPCEKQIKPELLSQLEVRHEIFANWGPCGEVIRLDGSQSKNKVLLDAIHALKDVYHRHQSDNHTPVHHQKHPSPLSLPPTPYPEQKRNLDNANANGEVWTPASGQLTDPLPERYRWNDWIWISFIGRPYRKITTPQKRMSGSELRILIAHALGVPATVICVHHENKIVTSHERITLHNGAFLRVELGLAGGNRGRKSQHDVSGLRGTGAETTISSGFRAPAFYESSRVHGYGVEPTSTRLRVRPPGKCASPSGPGSDSA